MWPRPWLRTVSHQLRSKHCFAVTSSSSSPPPSPASSSPPPLPSWPSPPSRHCLQLQNHLYRHIQQLTFSMIWNFNFIKPALASPWIALFIPYKYRYTRTVIDSTQRYVVREYTCNKWGHSVETIALLMFWPARWQCRAYYHHLTQLGIFVRFKKIPSFFLSLSLSLSLFLSHNYPSKRVPNFPPNPPRYFNLWWCTIFFRKIWSSQTF